MALGIGLVAGCATQRTTITEYPAFPAPLREETSQPRRESLSTPAPRDAPTPGRAGEDIASVRPEATARADVPRDDQPSRVPSGRADVDCADFSTSAAAQRYFLSRGGPGSDPDDLDRDGDGLACDWGTDPARTTPRRATPPRQAFDAPAPQAAGSRCYTGPRGGTYTITSGGNKNYDGC